MRMSPRVAVVAALALGVLLSPHTALAEQWNEHLQVRAEARAGQDGEVKITFEGREGWYVNTAYPGIRVELTAPEGVNLAKAQLGKAEVVYEERHPGDKAKRAVFAVPLQAAQAGGSVQGKYKIVICSASTCSPPFQGTFTADLAERGPAR